MISKETVAELGSAARGTVASVLPVLFGKRKGLLGIQDRGNGGAESLQQRRDILGGIEGQVDHVERRYQAGFDTVFDEVEAASGSSGRGEQHGALVRPAIGGSNVLGKGLYALVNEEADEG